MPKGFFTQSASVLLSKETSLDAVVPLLSEFKIAKRIDKSTAPELSGPALIIEFRPEVNGYVCVDIRNKKWPDEMGDPKVEPMLFAAWTMGYYGPHTFPGNLRRAQEQLWAWPEGKELVGRHAAVIHISTSFVFGAPKNAPIIPSDYDALVDVHFITRLALALLKHPDALMYFNSNGEILANEEMLLKSLAYHKQHQLPPFNIWVNVRLFNFGNGWLLMDTVGMEQLNLPDLEACFPSKRYDPNAISYFLRNSCLYLLNKGEVVNHRDTVDGPGNVKWQAYHVEKEIAAPPRRLIRFFPVDGSEPPLEMLPLESK